MPRSWIYTRSQLIRLLIIIILITLHIISIIAQKDIIIIFRLLLHFILKIIEFLFIICVDINTHFRCMFAFIIFNVFSLKRITGFLLREELLGKSILLLIRLWLLLIIVVIVNLWLSVLILRNRLSLIVKLVRSGC